MPYSSSALTSAASVKRGGGWVKCWSAWMRSSGTRSPIFIAGSLRPSSSSSLVLVSLPSSYTARKPGSTTVVPRGAEAVLAAGGQVDADTVLSVAGTICEATARFQISSYRRRSSSLRKRATCAGVRSAEVGRTASCASCAFFDLVCVDVGLVRQRAACRSRARSRRASRPAPPATGCTESVRM